VESLPNFDPSPASPPLPAVGVAITCEPAPTPADTLVRGSWRVPDDWPEDTPARDAIWLIAVGRNSRLCWNGRPAGDALPFADDAAREGWFNIRLGACCDLPDRFGGRLDVTAVLGEWKSKTLELEFAIPASR
jgi:hypothetical protein